MKKNVYFDYSATTPVDESVLTAMQPYFRENYGNSASQLHAFGWEAETAVENARKKISQVLKVQTKEIYFTSGATESNNWALQGLVHLWRNENANSPVHIISSNIEHNSIQKCLEYLQFNNKIEVSFLPVNQQGHVTLEQVKAALKPHTKLVTLMWANNELGSLNPMAEISQLTREKQIYFHTDATQAVGKISVDLEKIPVDLMSFSSHKIYGPKGVGALYIRQQNPKVQIQPLFFGGGQERGLRSGTVNVSGVVGFGKAMELVQANVESENTKAWEQRKHLLDLWKQAGLKFRINGAEKNAVPQVINISFLETGTRNLQLPGVAFSKGSACHSDKPEPSHVLSAIGVSQVDAENTLRISFGRMTSHEDFETLTKTLIQNLKK